MFSLGCIHPKARLGLENLLQDGSLASWHWLLAESVVSLLCGSLHRLAKGPQCIAAGFRQSEHSKRKPGRSSHVFRDLVSEDTHHCFYHILSVRSKPVSLAHIQRKGN